MNKEELKWSKKLKLSWLANMKEISGFLWYSGLHNFKSVMFFIRCFMSDTENQDLDEFHDVEEEAIFIKKEITVDVEPIIQLCKHSYEIILLVPDITGTEYVDPMTTSMDGIDELPVNEEAQSLMKMYLANVFGKTDCQQYVEKMFQIIFTHCSALEPSEDPAVPIDENALTEQVVPADEVEAEVKTEAPLEGELIQNETPLVEDEPVPHDTYVEVPVEEIGGEETTATTKDEPVEEELFDMDF
uniref:Cilia- and flagella-associated protein 36 n=1 Tax=Heterorhabditis bacteriophora TaxID=37862 RepID=A0A1I7X517_HETBA